MSAYSLSHLPDPVLLRNLAALVDRDRATTATLLAHLAEVDARRLYLPAAHPSMYSYCVHELGLSEDSAYKRIQAARTARQFPTIFELLADGRVHLSAVCLLAPHLTAGNARELLEAASHRTKAEVEQLIAQRFPRTEMFDMVEAVPVAGILNRQLAPGQVDAMVLERVGGGATQLAPGQVDGMVQGRTGADAAQLAPSMKTGCQASRFDDPSPPPVAHQPSIRGHGFCPRRRCGEQGPTRGLRASRPGG